MIHLFGKFEEGNQQQNWPKNMALIINYKNNNKTKMIKFAWNCDATNG
jgi:tRNA uridine 5-carbamoylmethylation protein Kti12